MPDRWSYLERERLPKRARLLLAKECLENFKSFCRLCEPPEYDWKSGHANIAESVEYNERGPDGRIRTLLEAPRAGGKSTILGERYTLWRIVRSAFSYKTEPYKDGAIRVLYATETAEKARERGQWLIGMLEDSNVTKVYGKFKSQRLWGAKKFIIKQRKHSASNPTFTAVSPEKSSTGGHFDLVVADDVVTEGNTRTLQSMQKMRGWFEEIMAQADPDSEIRVAGTPYHEDDLYASLEESPLWHVTKVSILDARFPNLTPAFLAVQKTEYGPARYAAYYELNPHPVELQVFRAATYKNIKKEDVPDVNLFLLADLACTEKGKDICETALWIVGVDAIGNKYMFDLKRGHFAPAKSIALMHGMMTLWMPNYIAMERRTLGPWVENAIRVKARETKTPMPVEFASAKGYLGKTEHIRGLQPEFSGGRMYFVDTMPKSEITWQSIGKQVVYRGPLPKIFARFPKTKELDALDALALLVASNEDEGPLCPKPRARRRGGWLATATGRQSPWRAPKFRRRHSPPKRWRNQNAGVGRVFA